MFPVPSHLPRNGGEHHASSLDKTATPEPSDPVLDILAPILAGAETSSSSGLSAKQVQTVRVKLQQAVTDNKAQGHKLLIDNFPSVSSHVRLGNELHSDFRKLQNAIRKLEREIDPTDTEASFLPRLLAALSRHFTAVEARSRARTHTDALRALSSHLERVEKLEEAVYAGRGADDWVISELDRGFEVSEGQDLLRETKVMKAAEARIQLFRSMVAEQVTDGYGKAVSFSTPTSGGHGISLVVQSRISLQRPRIPRPEEAGSPTKSSVPPPYPLSSIYTVLARLGSLSSILQNLRNRLLRDLIVPITSRESHSWRVEQSETDNLAILRLESTSQARSSSDVLGDLSLILNFIETRVFPAPSDPLPDRNIFLTDLQIATLQAILDDIVLPAMPSTMASVPVWLETVRAAVEFEATIIGASSTKHIIQPFFESSAGPAWAAQRRRRVAEEVRRLILGGWGGWEAVQANREKEMVIMEEVEVDDEDVVKEMNGKPDGDMEFGWDFDDKQAQEAKEPPAVSKASGNGMEVDEDGGGWGFAPETPMAGPSKRRHTPTTETNGDGWDFEDVGPPAPKPIASPKPAREAKRLGKKVAKVKTVVDDDVWGSETESVASSAPQNGHTTPSLPADDWGDWHDDAKQSTRKTSSTAPTEPELQPVKKGKKVLREERKTIRETFMVSRACEKLLEIAERVLREAQDVRSTPYVFSQSMITMLTDDRSISPSFSAADTVLTTSATDIFDIYRSLLPIHFASQIRDVPTIAMQLYNDSLHLSSKVLALHERYPCWETAEDAAKRLVSAGDHAFEEQLVAQRDAMMGILDEAGGFLDTGIDASFKRCERAVNQLQHNLESLARVLKAVLPTSTFISVLGYLLDTSVQRISSDILALVDITEIESNRLHDLVKLLQPLEALFILQPDQPSTIVAQVPHWLKFCYIAELLQANLVDITYLFDTGALVDFSTPELVSLIRALFADSEKRDKAIERIEGDAQPIATG